MKTLEQFMSEAVKSSDVHPDLQKLGTHKDQHGGYHIYTPSKKVSVANVAKVMAKHGFKRMTHYRSGGKVDVNTHMYERTPAPYHTEVVHLTHHDNGDVKHIHRSLQRG
jgi:hypothetical protein